MVKQIKNNKLDEATIQKYQKAKEFQSYIKKSKKMRIMQKHFDNNFALKIETVVPAPIAKTEEVKKAAVSLIAGIAKGKIVAE